MDVDSEEITYQYLFEIIQKSRKKSIELKFRDLEATILNKMGSETIPVKVRKNIAKFKADFKKQWNSVQRKPERFKLKYTNWLKLKFNIPRKSVPALARDHSNSKGRPKSTFLESSERTKRFKTTELRKNNCVGKLSYATQMSFRAEGNINASKILKDITNTPSMANKYHNAVHKEPSHIKLSSDEALSLLIEAKLSKSQYNFIRSRAKQNNCKLYPSYGEIIEAKKRCYPEDMLVHSEIEAEIPLLSLLNHTSKRLIDLQDVIQSQGHIENKLKLTLVCKWGFDGSSGQSEYKQKFENTENMDSSVFLTSLVPIKLIYKNDSDNPDSIIWQNTRTSSSRFCRPLKLQFVRETTELTLKEKRLMDEQISNLLPFDYVLNSKKISVDFDLHFTMIDGKVCNEIACNKSTQKCYICGASSKDFNNIDEIVSRPIIDDNLKYGLSTLHAWIRFFECLLHLAYKMDIKKCQARSPEDKLNVAESKKRIQTELRVQIGLIVDKPKPGFFENGETVSKIKNIDFNLIQRFYVILQTLSSGFDINTEKFSKFALDTAKLFVSLYPWCFMTPTVHKILIHGGAIINYFLLPIGQLSEEAQEARNKDIKKYRADFSRKTSRKDNLKDIVNRLCVSSDPLITSLRKLPNKKIKAFLPQVLDLLEPPKVTPKTDISSSEDISQYLSRSDEE